MPAVIYWCQRLPKVKLRGPLKVAGLGATTEDKIMQKKYILKTDPRCPSRDNLWGAEPAETAEEAKERFKTKIGNSHNSSDWSHFRKMDEDRKRRLAEDDFEVEIEE